MRSAEKDSSEHCKRQQRTASTDVKPLLLQQRMQNLHLCPDWDGTLQNTVDAGCRLRAVCLLSSLILLD